MPKAEASIVRGGRGASFFLTNPIVAHSPIDFTLFVHIDIISGAVNRILAWDRLARDTNECLLQ